jgi:hypothetical protein
MISFGWNWQILATPSVHIGWLWPSQCGCGHGHVEIHIYAGPFRLEMGL